MQNVTNQQPLSSGLKKTEIKAESITENAPGKAKSVQQTTDDAQILPAPEKPAAGDGRRRLRARRARPADAAPDSSDEYGPRSPSSGESAPKSDDWQPGGWHD